MSSSIPALSPKRTNRAIETSTMRSALKATRVRQWKRFGTDRERLRWTVVRRGLTHATVLHGCILTGRVFGTRFRVLFGLVGEF